MRLSRFLATRRQIVLRSVSIGERLWDRNPTSHPERFVLGVHVRRKSSQSKPIVSTFCSDYTDKTSLVSSLLAGDSVELKDGDFLRIIRVSQKRRFVHGWRFCHLSKISGLPQNLPNEVCWVVHMKDGDLQSQRQQCMEKISVSEVLQKKQLILTDQAEQSLSGVIKSPNPKVELIQDQSALVCRWKYVCCVKRNRRARPLTNVQFYSPDNEWSAIIRLRKDECDEGVMYPTDNNTLRDASRGDNNKVDDYPESKKIYIDYLVEDFSRLNVDETSLSYGKQGESLPEGSLPSNKKREGVYTFGDAFCGAGGVSRGAVMANLQVQWGFDSSLNAYEAYRANFPQAALLLTAADFIGHRSINSKVDVLHLSPPCQAFSIANTRPNPEKNRINIAASMTIAGILLTAKPRVVTLEQTPGIVLITKHQQYFDEVLRQFTRLGYSIRWKIMKFVEYGLPQERARLIVIASGYVTILT